MKLKPGIKLIADLEGTGDYVQRQKHYVLAIRLTLNRGEIVTSPNRCLSHTIDKYLQVSDDGFFQHRVRIDRENLIAGIFYGVQGMKVNGYRQAIPSQKKDQKEYLLSRGFEQERVIFALFWSLFR